MRGSMDCKNASKESLRDSGEARKALVLGEERGDLLERVAVGDGESVSSSYIMDSAGVTRKEGAAKRKPPVATCFLESLRIV